MKHTLLFGLLLLLALASAKIFRPAAVPPGQSEELSGATTGTSVDSDVQRRMILEQMAQVLAERDLSFEVSFAGSDGLRQPTIPNTIRNHPSFIGAIPGTVDGYVRDTAYRAGWDYPASLGRLPLLTPPSTSDPQWVDIWQQRDAIERSLQDLHSAPPDASPPKPTSP